MFLCLCEMAAEEFVAKQINWYTIVNLLFIVRFLFKEYLHLIWAADVIMTRFILLLFNALFIGMCRGP